MEKSFTTEPRNRTRRGHSPVRDRCLEYMSILKELDYTNQIPLDHAKQLFQTRLRIMDRASLKAYFGTQATRSVRKIQRIARYATGTMSFKTLELSQDVQARKGYFELLGLANIEKRGPTYFLILKEASVVPNLSCHTNESVCGSDVSNESIPRISLSPYSIAALEEGYGGTAIIVKPMGRLAVPPKNRGRHERERQQTHTLQDEREKLSMEQELTLKLTQEHTQQT